LKPGKLVSTIEGGWDDDQPLYVDYLVVEPPEKKQRLRKVVSLIATAMS
jgi:hypothetical protein